MREKDSYFEWVHNLDVAERHKIRTINENEKIFSNDVKTILDTRK